MKKLCSLVLSVSMIMSLIVPSFASSSTFDTEIAFLQEYGIPSKLLNSLSYDEIHNWYVYAQSGRLYYDGTTTVPLYTDEGDTPTLGTISTADMHMDIAIFLFLNKDSSINFMTFTIDYKWAEGHPLVRKNDGVTVNWDPNLFYMEPNSFESIDDCYLAGRLVNSYGFENPAHLEQGGLGYSVKLYDNIPGAVSSFEGTAKFNLNTRRTLYYYKENNKYSSSVNIEYAHDKTPYLGGINFSSVGKAVSMSLPAGSDTVAHNRVVWYN